MQINSWARPQSIIQNKKLVGMVAALFSALVLVMTPAMASAQSAVEIGGQAKLKAGGAAVVLPVTVTCDPAIGSFNLSAEVTQRTREGLAKGFGFTSEVTCNGTPQTTNMFIHAQTTWFRKGPAAVTATFSVCSDFGPCESVSDSGVVVFVK